MTNKEKTFGFAARADLSETGGTLEVKCEGPTAAPIVCYAMMASLIDCMIRSNVNPELTFQEARKAVKFVGPAVDRANA
jgi:hypothetical protein